MHLTICTPFYSEPLWMLKRNLDSVAKDIANNEYDIEQIVVIDREVLLDEVTILISKYPHARFIKHKENLGLSTARNSALKYAIGKYFMLLDTDDVCAPGRLKKQIEFMEFWNLDHSYGGYQEVHGEELVPAENAQIIMPPEFDSSYLLNGQNICYCGSNMIRTDAIRFTGGFDESMKEGAEDFEMWIRLYNEGYTTKLLPEILYYLGVHSQNMTAKLVADGGFHRAYLYIKSKYPNLKFNF